MSEAIETDQYIKKERKDDIQNFSDKTKDNTETIDQTKEELSKLKDQILEDPNKKLQIEKQKLNESITTKRDSLELLGSYKDTNIESKVIPTTSNITKQILAEKLSIKSHAFEDFEKAKKILLTWKNETIKEILNIPWIDAYFFWIIKNESSGELKRNANKKYFWYGQISKAAEKEISLKLNRTLDRMKWVDNCIILIWYITTCREKLIPYVKEKDLSKFALIWFKKWIEWLKWKLKIMFSEWNKISREDYLKKENKNNGSLYVNNVRESFEKIHKELA